MKLLLVLLISLNLMAIEEDKILPETKKQISVVLDTLKSSKSSEEKKQDILNSIDTIIDFKVMSKIAIGNDYFSKLSKEQQERYVSVFTAKIQDSYYTKLENYTNESIEFKPLQKPKDTRIFVPVLIYNKADIYELIFKYYKNESNDWKIYDVDIVGVSLTFSYKNQIQDILSKNKDFDNLIAMIQK